jgi:AcrR family transcriptional regulator
MYMETTSPQKTNKKKAGIGPQTRIELAYIDFLLNHGQRPASVFKFAQDVGIKEDDFYIYFGSFEGLDQAIWKGFIERTVQRLMTDTAYAGFSVREKILAFYYTFFEDLKANRSFVLLQLNQEAKRELVPPYLKEFKGAYSSYIEDLLSLGKTTGEIRNRPYLDKVYPRLFWMQMAFLLTFWRNDNSAGFEQTDAAVEKSVNLAFDLIGKGAIDTAFDFAKFLIQTKTK